MLPDGLVDWTEQGGKGTFGPLVQKMAQGSGDCDEEEGEHVLFGNLLRDRRTAYTE